MCGHRFHQILNLGDKMQYRILGGYGSLYHNWLTTVTYKNRYYSLGMEASIGTYLS